MASRDEVLARRREVIRLSPEGMAVQEVASRLGVPPQTVYNDLVFLRDRRQVGRRETLWRLLCGLTQAERHHLGRVLLDGWRQPDSTAPPAGRARWLVQRGASPTPGARWWRASP